MGIGQALFEETHYDSNTGRVVNDNLADYVVCVTPDVHSIETHFVGEPDMAFSTPSAAVAWARLESPGSMRQLPTRRFLHATGIRIRDLPTTAEKVYCVRSDLSPVDSFPVRWEQFLEHFFLRS